MFFEIQLRWIEAIQSIRNNFLDTFFSLWNWVDTSYFYSFIILLVWLRFGWKWGAKLFYLIVVSGILSYSIKELCQLPRPFHLIESLGIAKVSGYGFPSGAAQNAVLLSGFLIVSWKKHKICSWIIGSIFFILLSFSRIYLGVHFFTDILGGWIVGATVLLAYIHFMPLIEKDIQRKNLWMYFLIGEILPLPVLLYNPSNPFAQITCFAVMAMTLGLSTSFYFHLLPKKTFPHTFPQESFLIGGCILLSLVGTLFLSSAITNSVIILWVSLGIFAAFRFFPFLKKYKK